MRAAIVENGVVTNIITVDDDYTGKATPTYDFPVQIGDTYDGENFLRDGVIVTEQNNLQIETDAIAEDYANTFGIETNTKTDGENEADS